MLYYGTDYTYESLSHYGVPGMRWGKRKPRIVVAKKSTRVKRDASFENDVNKQVEAELRRQRKKAMRKKVAYGLAGAAVAAGVAYAVHKNKQKKLNVPSIKPNILPNGKPTYLPNMSSTSSPPPVPGNKKTYSIQGRLMSYAKPSKSVSGKLGQTIKDVAKNSTSKVKKNNFSAAKLNTSFSDTSAQLINGTNDLLKRNKKRK